MRSSIGVQWLAFSMLSALCLSAHAVDRALIVGVGKYQNPGISDLSNSGVPEDVEMYTDIAQMIGIARSNIRVLKDEQATAANIEQAIRSWLQTGVEPGDKAFFAYSGHGTFIADNNGDEKDGRDEGLVPHDATVVNGEAHNYLWDDQLEALLGDIPTDDVYVFIDSCHSGSITRSWGGGNELGVSEVQARYTATPAGVKRPQSAFASRSVDQLDVPYLSFNAAQDSQYSYGSHRGGIFTLSIYQQIKEMAATGQALTPIQMMERSKSDILRWAGGSDKAFEPNVVGPAQKLARPFQLQDISVPAQNGNGPLWQRLEALVEASDAPLDLRLNQSSFHLGDYLSIAALLPSGGYLNIVSVDAQDNATVLYPNATHPDNRVSPGALTLPSPEMEFGLMASEPVGPNLIVAILSAKRVNLHELGFGERGNDIEQPFRALSMSGLRAFTVTPTDGAASDGYRASAIRTQVSH